MSRSPRRFLAAVATTAVVLLSAVGVHAQMGPCEQACIDQWEQDAAECEQQLEADLSQIDQQLQDCLAGAGGIVEQVLCLRQANVGRALARQKFERCISVANTIAYNCLRDCQMSPSAP
ncbi:MAG: hypothetical protein JSV80_07190 [Acidobacteriota bacterium]|nr:MAG: hypothetical protein JSV80_07190 [Acidobacteriota bacterium]